MKFFKIYFIAIMLLTFLPLVSAYSFESNIQEVGFDIGEFEGYDGGDTGPPPEYVENEEFDNNETNDSSNDSPVEYDPDNPYAEWER